MLLRLNLLRAGFMRAISAGAFKEVSCDEENKYRSRRLETLHKTAETLHKVGALDKARMRDIEAFSLTKVEALSACAFNLFASGKESAKRFWLGISTSAPSWSAIGSGGPSVQAVPPSNFLFWSAPRDSTQSPDAALEEA
jgi:hypothetical protein